MTEYIYLVHWYFADSTAYDSDGLQEQTIICKDLGTARNERDWIIQDKKENYFSGDEWNKLIVSISRIEGNSHWTLGNEIILKDETKIVDAYVKPIFTEYFQKECDK